MIDDETVPDFWSDGGEIEISHAKARLVWKLSTLCERLLPSLMIHMGVSLPDVGFLEEGWRSRLPNYEAIRQDADPMPSRV